MGPGNPGAGGIAVPWRIAVGGLAHESNTFAPGRTQTFATRSGPDIVADAAAVLGGDQVQIVPLLSAGTMPGPTVSGPTYRALRDRLLDQLRVALPVDGVLLHLHGAMVVDDVPEGEGDLVRSVRAAVGPDALIAVSLDLHANLSDLVVGHANIITAYRTAPHRDVTETEARAAHLLLRSLRAGTRPRAHIVRLPLLLPGERAVTTSEPAASLFGELPGRVGRDGILDASLLVGMAWADVERSGSASVVTGLDPAAAQRCAHDLAAGFWVARRAFGYAVESGAPEDCVRRALAAREAPVFISDSGDNPTAGAPGDVPVLLEVMLAHGVSDAVFAGIADAEAVEACARAGTGQPVVADLGGKLDPDFPPLHIEGEVERVVRSAGAPYGAVLRVGGVRVLLSASRQSFTTVAAFAPFEVDPFGHRLVGVKMGYLFPELAERAGLALLGLTPGKTDLELSRLPYRHVPRPIFPLDPETVWV